MHVIFSILILCVFIRCRPSGHNYYVSVAIKMGGNHLPTLMRPRMCMEGVTSLIHLSLCLCVVCVCSVYVVLCRVMILLRKRCDRLAPWVPRLVECGLFCVSTGVRTPRSVPRGNNNRTKHQSQEEQRPGYSVLLFSC